VGGAGLVGVDAPSYRGFRFPGEIISHGVWLYYRFPLSFREVQEMTAPRGALSYPRYSREELEGRFLGLMAYLDPKR
jgi:hypothetical protein